MTILATIVKKMFLSSPRMQKKVNMKVIVNESYQRNTRLMDKIVMLVQWLNQNTIDTNMIMENRQMIKDGKNLPVKN